MMRIRIANRIRIKSAGWALSDFFRISAILGKSVFSYLA